MRHLLSALSASALLSSPASALAQDSLRLSFAKSSETDLVTVVVGDYQASPESNYLIDATYGRQIAGQLFGAPIQTSLNVGLQSLQERGYQKDGLGATAFVKLHYDWRLPWTGATVRLGLGEGLSYVSRIPMSEQRDFAKKGVESEKLMNYLEWTIDLPLRQFSTVFDAREDGVQELSVGFIVWHRSSIFGLMADSGGGVNFMGFGVEAHF